MPESLYHLILFASLCNLGCNIYMGFLEAPVHGFLLDAYAVDHQIWAVDEVSNALIIPSIKVLHLHHLQYDTKISQGRKHDPAPGSKSKQ